MEPSPETATSSPHAALGITPAAPDPTAKGSVPPAPTVASKVAKSPAAMAALTAGSSALPGTGSPGDLQGYSAVPSEGGAGGDAAAARQDASTPPARGRGPDPAAESPGDRVRALDAEVLELRQRLSSALRVHHVMLS